MCNNLNINKRILYSFCTIFFLKLVFTQNSLVGDGFGGRLWYRPTNYAVGSYSGYSICYSGLCNDGPNQLYGWGANNYEQLGYSYTAINGISTPTPVPNMNNVKYYSTGYIMGAIKNDSSGWVWGAGLGAPTQVITNAKFLDASSTTISFVKHDGTVWSVGSNTYGNFGDGTNNNASTLPVQMQNITNAVRVANNMYSTIILLADGTLKSVGSNQFGTLGIGNSSIIQVLTPSTIPLLSNIVDIKATTQNVAALDINGDVYTWGEGYGIGDGDISTEYSPKKITALSNIIAISGCDDGGHFLALDINKNCYAWSGNNGGQIGVPLSIPYALTPTIVATDVIDIMAGETFSYIVKTDGSLWCTGFSNNGSIWLNLPDQHTYTFTLVNPAMVSGACSVSSALATTNPACNTNDGSIIVYQSGGQGPNTYNIGNGNQISNVFTGLTAGNYTVTITDNNTCVTTVTCAVGTRSGPSPTITVNNPTICAGASTIITANGADDYVWTNASTLNSASGYSVIANPTVTTIYTITGTNNNACTGFNTSTVTVFEKPTITVSSDSICIGNSVIFNTSASGTHSWSPSNMLNTTTGASVIATPTSNTTYTLYSNNGTCSFIDTQTIIVDNIIPSANFSGITDSNVSSGTILQLNNTSSNSSSFKWISCDNSVNTNSVLVLPLNMVGNCCISLVAYNNTCSDTTTSCINVFLESEILIPNVFTPNGDQVNDVFKITSKGIKLLQCEIYNRWGIKLYEWEGIDGYWDGQTKYGMAPNGTYFFIVNYSDNGDNSKTHKGFLTLFSK